MRVPKVKKVYRGVLSACLVLLASFPLFAVDMTVRFQQGNALLSTIYSGCADTYLRSAYPDAAPGKFGEIQVGYESFNGGGIMRGLIRYDVSGLKPGMTPQTAISAVRLKIYVNGQVGGAAFTNSTLNLYRIAAANKGWVAGSSTLRTVAVPGAACWNYQLYDNTGYPIGDPRAGQLRHQPWAGYFSTDSAKGCGKSGTDYGTVPVATAVVSSADLTSGRWVTFTLTDYSFLTDWIYTPTNNSGFLIRFTALEAGTPAAFNGLRIASSEASGASTRPILEVDVTNFSADDLGGIGYTLTAPAQVSAHISDSTGKVVRELLFKTDRVAGFNIESWDCKRDWIYKGDTVNLTVPDGRYTARILATPAGLSAEYLMTIGTTASGADGWPGNHSSVRTIAVDDSNAYIGAGCNENWFAWIKMKFDGTRVWSLRNFSNFDGTPAIALSGDTLFALAQSGPGIRWWRTGSVTGNPITWSSTLSGGSSYDLAAYKGTIVESVIGGNKIAWINRTNGAATEVAVVDAKGVAVDTNGNALVISGSEVRRYTAGGGTTFSVVIPSSGLISPYRLDVNKKNGEIYVACIGASQQVKRFSATGTLLQTYGQFGGRPLQGVYNAAIGFRTITDIAVAGDGSFWITEPYSPPKRTAHFAKDGSLIKEWYGGQTYANHGSADPTNPTDVWMDCDILNLGPERTGGSQLIRATVDYVNKTWTVRGTYATNETIADSLNLIGPHFHEGGRWNVKKIDGMIYLARDQYPKVLYFDSTADRLKPVASVQGKPSNILTGVAFKEMSWYDKNGNGTWSENEFTLTNIVDSRAPWGIMWSATESASYIPCP